MPAVNGPSGNITFPSGWAIHVQGWAMEISHELDDVAAINTVYDDLDPVNIHWRGVAVGKIESGSRTAPSGMYGPSPTLSNAKGTVTLTTAAGKTWTGTAVINSVPMERTRTTSDISIAFVGSGSITEAHA